MRVKLAQALIPGYRIIPESKVDDFFVESILKHPLIGVVNLRSPGMIIWFWDYEVFSLFRKIGGSEPISYFPD